jgi:hypothetical protein
MENINYVGIEEADKIFSKVDSYIDKNYRNIPRRYKSQLREIRRYLYHAKRSPLVLSNSFDSFKRWNKFTNSPKDILSFIGIIDRLDLIKEHLIDLPMLIQDAALEFSKNKPIYTKLIEFLELDEYKSKIIVVHEYDRVKLKNILSDTINIKNIYVSTWKRIRNLIKDLKKENTVIIAVEPPSYGDNLHSTLVDQIYFLLNPDSLNIVSELISSMKIGHSNYPIYFVDELKNAPNLLIKVEENLEDEKKEVIISEFAPDLVDDYKNWCKQEIFRPSDGDASVSQNRTIIDKKEEINIIDKDKEAIIAYESESDNCMIFPLHSSIYVVGRTDGAVIAEELIGNYEKNPIAISISKKGISIKVHFADWLVNDIDIGQITRGEFKWDSFYDLLKDSVSWTEYLRNEAEGYEEEKDLAGKISNSRTTAKDVDYILNWWQSIEGIISTPDGENIIIPTIEHPKAKTDLEYIADIIQDYSLKKSSERIWEASQEIQSLRNRFLNGFQKIVIDNENIKEKMGTTYQNKIIEILQEQNIPDFFKDLFQDFEIFKAREIKRINLEKSLPSFKKIKVDDTKKRIYYFDKRADNTLMIEEDGLQEVSDTKRLNETIPPWMIKHLCSEAKKYDILTSKERHKLFNFANGKQKKFNYSKNQNDFFDDLIKEVIESNILSKSIEMDNCEICKNIKNLLQKNNLL